MNNGFIRAASVTPLLSPGDTGFNAERILEDIRIAWEHQAKLIVFPELCITGYTCGDLFHQRLFLDKALSALETLMKGTEAMDALVIVGLPVIYGNAVYDAAAVLQSGKILCIIPKSVISSEGACDQGRFFAPWTRENTEISIFGENVPFGNKFIICPDTLPELKVGVHVGAEAFGILEDSIEKCRAGATIIAALGAHPANIYGSSSLNELMVSHSAALTCGYICSAAGACESTGDMVFDGGGVIAENGCILASENGVRSEGILFADLDMELISNERRKSCLNDGSHCGHTAETDSCEAIFCHMERTSLTEPYRDYPRLPFVPWKTEDIQEKLGLAAEIQRNALEIRMKRSGVSRLVLGISGGLDSTLALLAAYDTMKHMELPFTNILAVTMPCFGTSDRTYDNACNLIRQMGATFREIDIREAVLKHFRDIGHDSSVRNVVYENAQARERTQILMDMANMSDEAGMGPGQALVIGTGDMSELALGWATYNGDHMSMYGINAGIPKTMVRAMVRYHMEHSDNKRIRDILGDIIDTPVSPELLPGDDGGQGQFTEDLLGPYELHDFFLYYMLRYGFGPEKILGMAERTFMGDYERKYIAECMRVFYRRFFSQQFKRSCMPDGPMMGELSLSPRGGLVLPSDISGKLWQQEMERILK